MRGTSTVAKKATMLVEQIASPDVTLPLSDVGDVFVAPTDHPVERERSR